MFLPVERVELPEDCRVKLEVEPLEPASEDGGDVEAVYEMMSRRFRSGRHDLAERHDEHQP